uniref:Uncharacterized protein n=1 Tax=Catharus ustulatus TaxID=91951 RepID=A0A8C3UIW1_CATUS
GKSRLDVIVFVIVFIWLGATWESGRCPWPWQGVGTRSALGSLPTQPIPGFHNSVLYPDAPSSFNASKPPAPSPFQRLFPLSHLSPGLILSPCRL